MFLRNVTHSYELMNTISLLYLKIIGSEFKKNPITSNEGDNSRPLE